jgi:hypothetical protein
VFLTVGQSDPEKKAQFMQTSGLSAEACQQIMDSQAPDKSQFENIESVI